MMMPSNNLRLYDPNEWRRVGGRDLQFFATDDELQAYLHDLAPEFGPYDTLGEDLVENPTGPRPYRREFFVAPIDEHFEKLRLGRRIPMNIFIRPTALVPVLPVREIGMEAWCVVNGLILLQHGLTREGKREASRIAISDKIVNEAGERVELKPQRGIFESLRKWIKKDLAYASILVSRDGHEEESTLQSMTAAAAQLAREGFFDRRPGRCLR